MKTRSAPAPASQEDGGLSGERGREQGGGGGGRTCLRTGSVCQWEFRGFFQWKDCLTEQLEAGRAWKGGDRGGLSRRVSLGAQCGPVPGSGIEGAAKGRQEPGPAGVPSAELGRAARLSCLGHWWLPVLVTG